ncbi:MAG: hypothetical protein BJ554DRAFT_6232 [Olpidium bornovanus]|uniref:Uncharacterized protein n=1 Tax=Olpidium bornovanus TaxID=278681 RepID=A0A8H7ZY65_9FUNG|nr:MAG: hypothetical protein BJ554DRAFT_6232 [Olpidium bornovanus]
MLRHAVCPRAVRLPTLAHRRNFSLREWAQKHDAPFAGPVWKVAPPDLRLPWDQPVKIDLPLIEQRWYELPEAHRAAIIRFLWEKQRGDWNKMTMDEKKACE